MSKFRIRKYPRGFVVEIQREKGWLFKKKYWTHYISVAGIESMPWYFKQRDSALAELLLKVKYETLENSR